MEDGGRNAGSRPPRIAFLIITFAVIHILVQLNVSTNQLLRSYCTNRRVKSHNPSLCVHTVERYANTESFYYQIMKKVKNNNIRYHNETEPYEVGHQDRRPKGLLELPASEIHS